MLLATPAQGRSVFGIQLDRLAEGRKRKLVPFGRTAHEEVPPEQNLGVRLRVGGGALERRGLFRGGATTSGKPSASATTTYDSTVSGQCSPGITGSMICRTANAAMPYPTSARNTRRRFSSSRRGRSTDPGV